MTDRPVRIAPSVLTADFARLGEVCVELEKAGADRIHFDIMDRHFVPNLTFGADVVASIRPLVDIPFEAHLMVQNPDAVLEDFADAGCGTLIVHAEAGVHLHRTLHHVGELGAEPAIALNPSTPPDAVRYVLDLVRMVLVMTVNPGFGGQEYIRSMEPKIAEIRSMVDDLGLDVDVEVDGGVGPATVAGTCCAGANALVAGSALFRDAEGFRHAIDDLRSRAEAARDA
ncbi:MAG: ribulose-phosphate 3-epimerase [Acidimicrobiia bacterium]|nr:ribulose-phosphate 3-epimerase [Acidimicrobiia bacterium]